MDILGKLKDCHSYYLLLSNVTTPLSFFRDLSAILPLVETWRLDKVDVYNNHAASYVNLIRLMEDSPKMKHLR